MSSRYKVDGQAAGQVISWNSQNHYYFQNKSATYSYPTLILYNFRKIQKTEINWRILLKCLIISYNLFLPSTWSFHFHHCIRILISPVLAICPIHLTLLDLITLSPLGEAYKLWNLIHPFLHDAHGFRQDYNPGHTCNCYHKIKYILVFKEYTYLRCYLQNNILIHKLSGELTHDPDYEFPESRYVHGMTEKM
jgi:hypothetical protein